MSLKKKITTSLFWMGISKCGVYAVQFISKLILAKLLAPDDFGLFALAFVLINILNFVNGFGLGPSIIADKAMDEKKLNTAFTLSIGIGVILFCISFISAPFLAAFFKNDTLTRMIHWLSLVFLITPLQSVPQALLAKSFQFKKTMYAELLSVLSFFGVAVFLASKGFHGWSLVIGQLMQTTVYSLIIFFVASYRFTLAYDRVSAKELFQSGKFIVVADLFVWLTLYIDTVFVGKLLGTEQLGFYSFAFNLAAVPVAAVAHTIGGVALPLFSQVQDNTQKLVTSFLKIMKLVFLCIIPLSLGVIAIGKHAVYGILGSKWLPMLIPLYILSVYGIIRSIAVIEAYLLIGVGKAQQMSYTQILEFGILLLLLYPATQKWGIIGTASVVFLARSIASVTYSFQTSYYTGMNAFKILAKACVVPGFCGICMFCSVLFLKFFLMPVFSWQTTVFLVICGGLIYSSLLFLIDKECVREIIELKQIIIAKIKTLS